jgi:hypothetical protein
MPGDGLKLLERVSELLLRLLLALFRASDALAEQLPLLHADLFQHRVVGLLAAEQRGQRQGGNGRTEVETSHEHAHRITHASTVPPRLSPGHAWRSPGARRPSGPAPSRAGRDAAWPGRPGATWASVVRFDASLALIGQPEGCVAAQPVSPPEPPGEQDRTIEAASQPSPRTRSLRRDLVRRRNSNPCISPARTEPRC